MLREGLLNIPDVGTVNVKQARAFLWHAAWLQEHMNRHWRAESPLHLDAGETVKFENFCLAIMGPGGTGKTAVLKLSEALTLFFAGSDTVRKLAPSNAAARLLGGNTLHSLCKLPFGGVRLTRKRGRLTKDALRRHRKTWESTLAAYIDELSMISADQFLQTEVRLRQAKQLHNSFGGLAVTVCGDFLQLPLVDREGTRKSLAMSNYDVPEVSDPDVAEDEVKDLQRKKEKLIESRQGFDLWRSFKRVVCLQVSVRALVLLSRLQVEMRSGSISDEMWDVYMSRVMVPEDPRLTEADSPFSSVDVQFIVHRHRIRVLRSFENALAESARLSQPLYLVQANDEAVRGDDAVKMTSDVRSELLHRVDPEKKLKACLAFCRSTLV